MKLSLSNCYFISTKFYWYNALLLAITLAACGGGSSADSTPTAAAPTPALVINGNSVPPEPSPTTNNSTVAGVDTNANGLRDDVERALAQRAASVNAFNDLVRYASAYQALAIPEAPKTRDEALIRMSKVSCSVGAARIGSSSEGLDALLANTAERNEAFQAFYDLLPGFGPEDLLPC